MGLPEARDRADRSIPRWVDGGRAVGVIVGLSRGDDMAVKTYGSSGTERPLGPDTLMEIGSITKTFTGLLLADRVLAGEVRLEDPIGRYLTVPRRGERETLSSTWPRTPPGSLAPAGS